MKYLIITKSLFILGYGFYIYFFKKYSFENMAAFIYFCLLLLLWFLILILIKLQDKKNEKS